MSSHEPPDRLPLKAVRDRRLRMAQDAEMTYGEHPGKPYSWIVMNAPMYVNWARTQPNPDDELVNLIRFADNAIGQGIPTETRLRDISNDTMGLGQYRGRTFAWIMFHFPAYIDTVVALVPHCSTDFFKLAQWAEYDGTLDFEGKWGPLRVKHVAWMHERQRLALERAAAKVNLE